MELAEPMIDAMASSQESYARAMSHLYELSGITISLSSAVVAMQGPRTGWSGLRRQMGSMDARERHRYVTLLDASQGAISTGKPMEYFWLIGAMTTTQVDDEFNTYAEAARLMRKYLVSKNKALALAASPSLKELYETRTAEEFHGTRFDYGF